MLTHDVHHLLDYVMHPFTTTDRQNFKVASSFFFWKLQNLAMLRLISGISRKSNVRFSECLPETSASFQASKGRRLFILQPAGKDSVVRGKGEARICELLTVVLTGDQKKLFSSAMMPLVWIMRFWLHHRSLCSYYKVLQLSPTRTKNIFLWLNDILGGRNNWHGLVLLLVARCLRLSTPRVIKG